MKKDVYLMRNKSYMLENRTHKKYCNIQSQKTNMVKTINMAKFTEN